MENFLKEKNANEISKNETKKNTGNRNLKNNVKHLRLNENKDLSVSVEKKNITDKNNIAKKSKIINEQKNNILKVENSSSSMNSKSKSNEYINMYNKAQSINHVIGKKKNKEKLKKKKKLVENELQEKLDNKYNDADEDISTKNDSTEKSEMVVKERENNVNDNQKPEKDNKQIILELKNTLNIVDNFNSSNKIDGLTSDEVKILDNWYFANKLKIITCLFEYKPLHINLLNSLYSIHPFFKNNKSKIIIYLKYMKKKYENSLKEGKKNEKEEKEKNLSLNCKNTILNLLENNIENLKQKEYMAKFVTLIKNENSYAKLKHYFNFLLVCQINIYETFSEQNGILCIKCILQRIAKSKLIKKNVVLIIHILNFLKKLNITIDHLKSTLIGIPINFIARNKLDEQNGMDYRTNDETAINIAKELINKWKLIRDKTLNSKNGEQVDKSMNKNVITQIENKIEKIENNLEKHSKNGTNGIYMERKSKNEVILKNIVNDNNTSNNNNKTNNTNILKNIEDVTNNVQLSSNYSKSIMRNDKKLIDENKEKSKNKNSTKSTESKNIMLEIIDTLNEEYEKKKKRHLEYKKAKIEGKIKRFSALKNNSENSKNDNLLADIKNISKLDFDNTLNKKIKINDIAGINNNFNDIKSNIQNYNCNINVMNRTSNNFAPFDKYKIKENYTIDNNIKNKSPNELANESYKNILLHHNLNRNIQSQGNIRDKENLIDSHVYLNKYNTYDVDPMNSNYFSNSISHNINNIKNKNDNDNNYKANEINNNPSNIKNVNNIDYLNKHILSNSIYYNIHDKIINSGNCKIKSDIITPNNILKKTSNENFNSFSVNKNEYTTKNNSDENNYNFTRDKIHDQMKFINKKSDKYSYNKSYENDNLQETNKLNDKNSFKDPFEYYSNNQNDINGINQIEIESITKKIGDCNKNNISINNNTYSTYNSSEYSNYIQNDVSLSMYNNPLNALNYQNTLQNKENSLFFNNNTILKENSKNNIQNIYNNSPNDIINANEKNINYNNFYSNMYSNNSLSNSLDKNTREQVEINDVTHINSPPDFIKKKVDSNIIETEEKGTCLNNIDKNSTDNNLFYNTNENNLRNLKEVKGNKSEHVMSVYGNDSTSLYNSNLNNPSLELNKLIDKNVYDVNDNSIKVKNQELHEDNIKTGYYNFGNNINTSDHFLNKECYRLNSTDFKNISSNLKDISESNREENEKNNKKIYLENKVNNYSQFSEQKIAEFNNVNMKSNNNFLNTKEMLDNSLNEIFKNFKNLEKIKVTYEIAVTDNYYPLKIYDDIEVIKNDLIINFIYNKSETVHIYLNNNISDVEKNNSERMKICNNSLFELNNSCSNLRNTESVNEKCNKNGINTLNNISNTNNLNNLSDINNLNNNFNILPLPELFNPPNLDELKLPFIPIISNLPSSPNIIPPILFPPYNTTNEYKEQVVNNINGVPNTTKNSTFCSNSKLNESFDEFIKKFDEDIQKILLKNTDLANLLMNKPNVVEKMLKGPQYINEALSSLEEELKNWNKSNLNS